MLALAKRQLRPRFLLKRSASGWSLGNLFRGKRKLEEHSSAEDIKKELEQSKSQEFASSEEALKRIAKEHIKDVTEKSWRTARIGDDLNIKGKILYSFERTFNRRIPNEKLTSISTFSHLLDLLTPHQGDNSKTQQPIKSNTFPNIKDDGSLPPNLSIQFINTAPKPRPERAPFQNYDSRRPEHANFLTKHEKERRKKKRRHLTSWK